MPAAPAPTRARGTAAVVLTRSDPLAGVNDPHPPVPAPDEPPPWPRWFATATAVALSGAVAWAWGLLLFGGSLRP